MTCMIEEEHCWHVVKYDPNPSGYPIFTERCCNCGQVEVENHTISEILHGPYYKEIVDTQIKINKEEVNNAKTES